MVAVFKVVIMSTQKYTLQYLVVITFFCSIYFVATLMKHIIDRIHQIGNKRYIVTYHALAKKKSIVSLLFNNVICIILSTTVFLFLLDRQLLFATPEIVESSI